MMMAATPMHILTHGIHDLAVLSSPDVASARVMASKRSVYTNGLSPTEATGKAAPGRRRTVRSSESIIALRPSAGPIEPISNAYRREVVIETTTAVHDCSRQIAGKGYVIAAARQGIMHTSISAYQLDKKLVRWLYKLRTSEQYSKGELSVQQKQLL